MASNLSIVPSGNQGCNQAEKYHEAVVDRFLCKLTNDRKVAALLAQLSPEQLSELKKENAAYFEFLSRVWIKSYSPIWEFSPMPTNTRCLKR